MNQELNPVFVIPTYRLRDVKNAIQAYDTNFHEFGTKIDIWIFDDSPFHFHDKYYPILEGTPTYNDVYYIGPHEKTEFIKSIIKQTGVRMADSVINRMFRPSYGGNRNFTATYTLGRMFISADDDMIPGGYMFKEKSKLNDNEYMVGSSVSEITDAEFVKFDVINSFLSVLGKKATSVNLPVGQYCLDPNYDLFTNSVKPDADTSTSKLILSPLESNLENTTIKIAQSFRSGTNDIDSIELLYALLRSKKPSIGALNETFVLSGFKPFITKENWRVDCGVSGYDNTQGLPPFFPTTLRFEDYSYRLFSQNKDVATAHINGLQHHHRNQYMRPTLAEDILNEMLANFLKQKIKETREESPDMPYAIMFSYDGLINQSESGMMIDTARELDELVKKTAENGKCNENKKKNLNEFRNHLSYVFRGFDADNFFRDISRWIDDELYSIRDCMVNWQNILEMSNFKILKGSMPMRKVKNQRR